MFFSAQIQKKIIIFAQEVKFKLLFELGHYIKLEQRCKVNFCMTITVTGHKYFNTESKLNSIPSYREIFLCYWDLLEGS
jgi:hypothetical protein